MGIYAVDNDRTSGTDDGPGADSRQTGKRPDVHTPARHRLDRWLPMGRIYVGFHIHLRLRQLLLLVGKQ